MLSSRNFEAASLVCGGQKGLPTAKFSHRPNTTQTPIQLHAPHYNTHQSCLIPVKEGHKAVFYLDAAPMLSRTCLFCGFAGSVPSNSDESVRGGCSGCAHGDGGGYGGGCAYGADFRDGSCFHDLKKWCDVCGSGSSHDAAAADVSVVGGVRGGGSGRDHPPKEPPFG